MNIPDEIMSEIMLNLNISILAGKEMANTCPRVNTDINYKTAKKYLDKAWQMLNNEIYESTLGKRAGLVDYENQKKDNI